MNPISIFELNKYFGSDVNHQKKEWEYVAYGECISCGWFGKRITNEYLCMDCVNKKDLNGSPYCKGRF